MTHTPDIDEQVNTAIRGMTEKILVRTGVNWQLQRTPYESEIDIVSDKRVIATVEAGDDKEKIAHLITAAPEMLKLLSEAVVSVEMGFDLTCTGWHDRAAAVVEKIAQESEG